MRLPCIQQLASDSMGTGFFLCTRKDVRTTRTGTPFLLFTLQDATGEVCAKLFDEFAKYRDEFDVGEFVKVEARAEIYNGRIELVVSRIRRVRPEQDREQGFRESECIPTSPRDVDDMWQELTARVGAVRDAGIRALLQRIVNDHEPQLRTWPAALTVHHAYRGGLLEHVLQVARAGLALAEVYGADADLVLAGAVLHDIGKLRELEYELATAYTREGNLVGHIALGLMMIRESAAGLASLADDRRAEVEHLIASHHGSREFGSPVEPMTVEAFILAAVDDLDAKLHQVQRHVAADEGDGEFTGYHSRLKRVFLKPSHRD
jgi:3'-5' exoribonuclease